MPSPSDWLAYEQHQGSDAAFARSIGMDPNNFAQHKRRHYQTKHPSTQTKPAAITIEVVPLEDINLTPTDNGNLPAIPSAHPIAVPSQHIAVPSQPIATELDDLKSRVATLEAFMAVVQAEHRSPSQPIAISQPIAAHRDGPWVSRGLQMAPDMLDAIDGYANRHRLEKRAVLDLALRTFFAQVGQEVGDDA